jgi:hypothetical protein
MHQKKITWWPIMSADVPVPDHFCRDEALMLINPDNLSFFTQLPALLENKGTDVLITGYEDNKKCRK